jgi:UDP-N-acetylmuramyl tripeptide synthase
MILLAGKGHEPYQEIKGKCHSRRRPCALALPRARP